MNRPAHTLRKAQKTPTNTAPKLCALLAFCLGALCCQDCSAQSSPKTTQEPKQHAPDQASPDLLQPETWTGREWLKDHGLSFNLAYYSELFTKLKGGMGTKRELKYRGLLDFIVEIDTTKLGLWRHGTLLFHAQNAHGSGVTPLVGAAQCISNIEADEFSQVSALFLRQEIIPERFWIQLGKQDGNDEFAASKYALDFLHSSAGFPPSIPLPSYPDQEWGALAGLKLCDNLSLKLGGFQGQANGGRSLRHSFSQLYAPLLISQLSLKHSLASLDGQLQIGAWYQYLRLDRLDREQSQYGNYGIYLIADQCLWCATENSKLSCFLQYAYAPPSLNEIDHYYGAGLQFSGLIWDRNQDKIGLAAYCVEFSRFADTDESRELALEAFLTVAIQSWLLATPNFQYIHKPGGSQSPDATVLGFRLTIQL